MFSIFLSDKNFTDKHFEKIYSCFIFPDIEKKHKNFQKSSRSVDYDQQGPSLTISCTISNIVHILVQCPTDHPSPNLSLVTQLTAHRSAHHTSPEYFTMVCLFVRGRRGQIQTLKNFNKSTLKIKENLFLLCREQTIMSLPSRTYDHN